MGGSFSAFNKFGLPGLTSATTAQVYDKHFKGKPTSKFEDFHIAYVDFCKYFNTVMPGQDFETPSREEIEEFYNNEWTNKENDEQLKRDKFFEFMERRVTEASVDDSFFIMTGLAAPAAAVIGKRASGHIPYVKSMRLDLVPNVVFVPVFTLGAIVVATAAHMSRKSATAKQQQDKSDAAEQNESKQD